MNISPPPKVAALLVILHDELIVKVLTFLEVKSLMRMRCVCKSWKTLMSDPVFVKMHLKKQSTRMTHLLALLAHKAKGSGDCRAVPISRLLETTSNSITFTDNDPYYQFNYQDAGRIVGSCNGLVCLQGLSSNSEYHEYSLSFWNPSTRKKSETLVSFRYYGNKYNMCKFAFGYDNSTDTYKVVVLCLKWDNNRLVTTAARVFTLGDSVWRDINFPLVYAWDGVYLKNSINWFARRRFYCHMKNLTIEQLVIISFDLGTETHKQFMLSRWYDEELHIPRKLSLTLSVLMDCICFSYDIKGTHFVIWQMKEFGDDESWVQFLKISYRNLQLDCKFRNLEPRYIPEYIVCPLCVSENGDKLIFAINHTDQAIVYNLRDNRVNRIKSTNQIPWFNAKGYVESLVPTS